MNVLLKFRERIAALSHPLLLEFEQLLTVIRTTFRVEHSDDGTHGDVTATNVSVATDNYEHIRLDRTESASVGRVYSIGVSYANGVDYLRLGATGGDPVVIDEHDRMGIGTTAPDTRLDIDAGAMEFAEMTAPSNGDANTGRLFCRDNGAGKTQLCVIFGSGAVQVVATEP